MERTDALEKLHFIIFDDSNNDNMRSNAQSMVDLMIKSKGVPDQVVSFLENFDPSLYKKNFISRMVHKRFLRGVTSESISTLSDIQVAKVMSSIITHALADIELGVSTGQVIFTSLRIDELTHQIINQFNQGFITEDGRDLLKELLS